MQSIFSFKRDYFSEFVICLTLKIQITFLEFFNMTMVICSISLNPSYLPFFSYFDHYFLIFLCKWALTFENDYIIVIT